ncbi:MAG TPA: prepilin-type N-terminal cleavage/methylation domain-containing protein [Stellaceae bacterium]|nr:prepilin-type N-terminal cleavage/methylation domain-containing protein [Stellaceae bacterium]
MAPCADKTGGSAGFSLIEVLIALTIAGLALTAISQVFGTGFLAHRANADAAAALTLAEGKIAAAGATEPLRPGVTRGEFTDRFKWEVDIARYRDTDEETPTASDVSHLSIALYRISTVVSWHDGGRARRLTLSTLRLGPAPP